MSNPDGVLYLVPTPIGNLEDITLRALRVLRDVDLIACEDTRTSRVLLDRYEIQTPVTSYHDHNERSRTPELIQRLEGGASVALVSDAGSPGISDPGFFLVRACLECGIRVEALPGPTAFVPALTASGMPADRFVFEGFLPAKKGRQTRLEELATESRTIIIYESPHRIVRTLRQLGEIMGADRPAAVVREVSKVYETVHRGSLGTLADEFAQADRVRGEIVLLVGPVPRKQRAD
ncbi:MAG: 16S rRNA (cytidine(1402)-2'-O)-methyltransferase [Rhodothermales bacterium]